MKRIIALILAVLMIAALFCACGEKKKTADNNTAAAENVVATVDAKYDQGFAEKYAKSVTTDENGNKVYEFDGNSYKNYVEDYNKSVSSEITDQVAKAHDEKFGQFCYVNDDKKAVIVGVNPGQYDEASASEEAKSLAEDAFPYFKGQKDPIDTVNVIYCNANDQSEVYGTFSFPIE